MNTLQTMTSLYGATIFKITSFLKMRWILIFLLGLFTPEPTMASNFDFSNLNVLLKNHVSSGTTDGIQLNTVNYRNLQLDPRFTLLVNDLKSFSPSLLESDNEKLAFWINVYNVFAIKVVIDNYPVKSIKDIGGFFKPVWKHKAGVVGGKEYSLDEIEHKILRKMGDPRIHVAIVCASVSCPDLATEAFEPASLNEQLDTQMRSFLSNSGKGMRLEIESKKLFLSSIFDWFEEDFESHGGVLKFIQPYVTAKYRTSFKNLSLRIFYMEYNWGLNGDSL